MLKQGITNNREPASVRGSQLRSCLSEATFSDRLSQNQELRPLLLHIAQMLPDGPVNPERIYITARIAALAEGFDSDVLPQVLATFGAASDCDLLARKLEKIAALGPLDEDGLRSAELDLGAALEALVVLSERGTERSGQLAASFAVDLASKRPEVAVGLAEATCEIISKRRKPVAQGLATLAVGLALTSSAAKSHLESNKLWRETGLRDLAEIFHSNDLGKLLVYSAFPAIYEVLQDCCCARPSFAKYISTSASTVIKNKICRRVKAGLIKYSSHSPQHFKQVLSIALECADQESEARVQTLAGQIMHEALENTPTQRDYLIDYLSKEVHEKGDARAASLLKVIMQPDELVGFISNTLNQCSQRKRIFERSLPALLILSHDDSSSVIAAFGRARSSLSRFGTAIKIEILRAIDRDARNRTGVADLLLEANVMAIVQPELAGENSVLAVRAAGSLAANTLSNYQHEASMTTLVAAIPLMSAEAFSALCELAPKLVTSLIAPAVAQTLSNLLSASGVQPESVVRCARFTAACCHDRHNVAACFELADIDGKLEPWIDWVNLSQQIAIDLAIARVREKPLPAERVVEPWLRKVMRAVESKAGLDDPQKRWVVDQIIGAQRRSQVWSDCTAQAICAELQNAVPASASFRLLIATATGLAMSSYAGAKALWHAGVHEQLFSSEHSELINLIKLGAKTNSDYTQAIIARGVTALRDFGDLKILTSVSADRSSNREMVRQLCTALQSETIAIGDRFNIFLGIKQLLLKEEYSTEPFTHALLASSIDEELNRQLDGAGELGLISNGADESTFELLALEILDIMHARRRG